MSNLEALAIISTVWLPAVNFSQGLEGVGDPLSPGFLLNISFQSISFFKVCIYIYIPIKLDKCYTRVFFRSNNQQHLTSHRDACTSLQIVRLRNQLKPQMNTQVNNITCIQYTNTGPAHITANLQLLSQEKAES